MKLAPQKAGTYLLVCSNNADFSYATNGISYNVFNVSNLSYSERQIDGKYEFYVTDRVSGQPLKSVKAEFYISKYNSLLRRYENRKIGEAMTNEDGFVSSKKITRHDYYSFSVKFSTKEDALLLANNFYNYKYNAPKSNGQTTTHFFIDRAILNHGFISFFDS